MIQRVLVFTPLICNRLCVVDNPWNIYVPQPQMVQENGEQSNNFNLEFRHFFLIQLTLLPWPKFLKSSHDMVIEQ